MYLNYISYQTVIDNEENILNVLKQETMDNFDNKIFVPFGLGLLKYIFYFFFISCFGTILYEVYFVLQRGSHKVQVPSVV